ncbi:hypothetical protein [Kushneria marisflavi]|uniref:Uncharacterized protein n=1 Tax=Kushneria marisflavi TaxID=157779 RepID=A0A240UR25_9GAMM|nr:hypothetical protein [Kushneria marisflavi]ART63941.1 hypothetical protein B9H00_13490 [Kushneria marisflavi]RKD85663.1 hypothetical protein C8D96_1555 [Kushneria marisflavi]
MKTHFQKLFYIVLFFFKSPKGLYFWGCFFLASSKVLQTIAFFLPIKVLIMLGSEKMPKYLSPFSEYMNYNDVLVFLIAIVPVVYVMHLAFGIFFRLLIDKDVARFTQKEYHVDGYGNANLGKLKRLHNHTSKAFSDIIVFLLTSVILLLINPILTLAIWVVTLLNLSLFVKKAFYVHDDTRITILKLHKRQFVEYIASSNYLIVFALLVVQMYLVSGEIYGAILALLLSRQLFQAVQRFSIENIYFSKLI